jgi:hypothetical protein
MTFPLNAFPGECQDRQESQSPIDAPLSLWIGSASPARSVPRHSPIAASGNWPVSPETG